MPLIYSYPYTIFVGIPAFAQAVWCISHRDTVRTQSLEALVMSTVYTYFIFAQQIVQRSARHNVYCVAVFFCSVFQVGVLYFIAQLCRQVLVKTAAEMHSAQLTAAATPATPPPATITL